jgi:hypothetical protein
MSAGEQAGWVFYYCWGVGKVYSVYNGGGYSHDFVSLVIKSNFYFPVPCAFACASSLLFPLLLRWARRKKEMIEWW